MADLKKPAGATRNKRIKGRGPGSGNGKTCGKGHKGQNARSGGGVRPGFEGGQMPLYRRIARRGFSNYPFRKNVYEIMLSDLERSFADGDTVSQEALREKKLVKKSVAMVKVLNTGSITKKLNLDGIAVTAGARSAIEAAGGTIAESAANKTE